MHKAISYFLLEIFVLKNERLSVNGLKNGHYSGSKICLEEPILAASFRRIFTTVFRSTA